MYPNEVELQWSILIVLYPYITGLVAGAFILASLERVFKVEAVKPTYRLALLTALAFLLVAPLPLQLHLGHPERSFEMYLTPHTTSAMAMFGFVYLWYLMVVLLLEIWLDYRKDIVRLARSHARARSGSSTGAHGPRLRQHQRALAADRRQGGYGSSPSSASPRPSCCTATSASSSARSRPTPGGPRPLMPIVFLFSAMVSGIAAVMLLYMVRLLGARRRRSTCDCVDTIARYLFYAFIIDFSLEMLDLIHRIYEADESFQSLDFMVHTRSVPAAHHRADRARHAGAPRCSSALDPAGEALRDGPGRALYATGRAS